MTLHPRSAPSPRTGLLLLVALGVVVGALVGAVWAKWGTRGLVAKYAADQSVVATEHVRGLNRLLLRMVSDAATMDAIARELQDSPGGTEALRAALRGATPRGVLGVRDIESGVELGEVLRGTARAVLPVPGGRITVVESGDAWRIEATATGGRVHLQLSLRVLGSATPPRTLHPSRLAITLLDVGESIVVLDRQTELAGVPGPGRTLKHADLPPEVRSAFAGDTVRRAMPRGVFDNQPTVVAAIPASAPALVFVLQRRTREVVGPVVLGSPLQREALAAGVTATLIVVLTGTLWRLRSLGKEQQRLASRHAFVTAVSHELRTPLAQIGAFAELLDEGALDSGEDRERAVRTILHETRRLELLVENVLSYGRPRVDAPTPSGLTAVIGRETEDVLAAFAPIAARAGTTVTAQIPPQLSVRMPAHALRQVLLNLLDNAVKYGPRASTVRVEARLLGSMVEIVVVDQGSGIARADAEEVWHPFVRGAGTERQPGSGLGLAVVRQLVTAAGGTATFAAPSGADTRVVLVLPHADHS